MEQAKKTYLTASTSSRRGSTSVISSRMSLVGAWWWRGEGSKCPLAFDPFPEEGRSLLLQLLRGATLKGWQLIGASGADEEQVDARDPPPALVSPVLIRVWRAPVSPPLVLWPPSQPSLPAAAAALDSIFLAALGCGSSSSSSNDSYKRRRVEWSGMERSGGGWGE